MVGALDGMGATLEREWFLCLVPIACVYPLITAIAAHRPFWFDELFTFYMTRLPSMSAVWAALKDGADLNPPLFYAATRFFQNLFGSSEAVTRMPAIIGFFVMMVGLFCFVSRYGSRLGGMVAMLFPLVTGAYYYAFEARAYGMELGFVALAAVSWQAATRGEKRPFTLPALSLCLAGALLTHCYAVLAVAPFGFAEVARSLVRKKFDWPVWAALAIPCLVVVTYLPMMSAVTGGDPFDNPVYRVSARTSYEMILVPAIWTLLPALAVLALFGTAGHRAADARRETVPFHEMVLVAGFLVAPLLGVGLASTITKIFMARYGLVAVLGLSIALGALVTKRTAQHPGVAVLVIAIVAGGYLWTPANVLLGTSASNTPAAKDIKLSDLDPTIPIVVANGILFLEYDHYESKNITDRLFFLIDRDTALRYTGTPGFAQFRELRKWFPIRSHLEDYNQFLKTCPTFYLISAYQFPMDWTMQKMRDDGVPLTFVNQFTSDQGTTILAKVSRPKPDSDSAVKPGIK